MSSNRTTSWSAFDKYIDDPAENYERHFVPAIGTPFARPLLEAARLRPGELLLDVACGTGIAARLAADAVGPTGKIAGLDLNPLMLDVARRVTAEGSPTQTAIEWHQGNAEELPLPDESFDAVVCSLSLQFFSDKVAALREIRRVLAPGGRAVLGTPGPTPPVFRALDAVLGRHMGAEASMFVRTVFSLHEPAEIRDLLERAEFSDVEAQRHPLSLRVAPPADFLWQYVQSTPLSAAAAQLDDDARAALERDAVAQCQPFVDGEAIVMDPGLLIATANV